MDKALLDTTITPRKAAMYSRERHEQSPVQPQFMRHSGDDWLGTQDPHQRLAAVHRQARMHHSGRPTTRKPAFIPIPEAHEQAFGV